MNKQKHLDEGSILAIGKFEIGIFDTRLCYREVKPRNMIVVTAWSHPGENLPAVDVLLEVHCAVRYLTLDTRSEPWRVH